MRRHNPARIKELRLLQEKARREFSKRLEPPFYIIPSIYRKIFGDKAAKYIVLKGGRGSGKTFAAVAYLIEQSFLPKYKDSTFLFLREIQKSIDESVYSVVSDLIKQAGLSDCFKVLKTEIVNTKNGVKFSFAGVRATGGKTAFSQANKLKGKHKVKFIFGDEAQDFTEESLNVLFPTVNRGGKIKLYHPLDEEPEDLTETRFIFAMNPNFDTDPIIAKVQNLDNSVIEHINIFDLPEEFQDPQLIEQAKQEEGQIYYNHVWLGEAHHKISGYPFANVDQLRTNEEMECMAFLDPSFSGGDFTALTFIGVKDGAPYFWGKVWRRGWNGVIGEIVDELNLYNAGRFWYESNSLGSVPADMFAEYGVEAIPHHSLGNKENRIYKVAAYTAHRVHMVINRCNSEYIENVLKYNEEAANDDAPDSYASACIVAGIVSNKMKF